MSDILEFEWYDEDELCSRVTINRTTSEVSVVNYTDKIYKQFLGKQDSTIENVYDMLELRCFDRRRPDADEILSCLGLINYDPLDICLKTNGRTTHDKYRINWVKT